MSSKFVLCLSQICLSQNLSSQERNNKNAERTI
jgi:hypothetical protein